MEYFSGNQFALVCRTHRIGDSECQRGYNKADIDASKGVWAWDAGIANNCESMHDYLDRKKWMVDMNTVRATVVLCPVSTR